MASASCSWTVYIGLRRARHWAKIRSSGTLSKPEGVRNPLTLDEPRRPQDVLRSSQWTSWSGLRSNSIPRTGPASVVGRWRGPAHQPAHIRRGSDGLSLLQATFDLFETRLGAGFVLVAAGGAAHADSGDR